MPLAETFAPGKGTELIRLLCSSELDAEDDKVGMHKMVKMCLANDSLSKFSFFSIYCKFLPVY